jgi:hypothetical protein
MFYKTGVDIANVKSMWNFLHDHYTYYTMNSWNRSKSIANNVKLYNLELEGDWTVAMKYLFDETDCVGLQSVIDDKIKEFEDTYPWASVFFNGRSGGYLVLGTKNNNGSVIPDCVADYDCYEDFKEDVKSGWNGYNVSDFNRELRDAVAVVRDFDRLCDELREIVNEYSKRSFDSDKLEAAIEWFNNEYGDDLVCLELTGPTMEGDRVKLNDLEGYKAFLTCFMICLGEDKNRATGNDGYLWLKEN